MRFLVVHRDQIANARVLLDETDVDDVEIIPYRNEKVPSIEIIERLRLNTGAELVLVGVRKNYKRILRDECAKYDCAITNEFSTVSGSSITIRQWLAPSTAATAEVLSPSAAFINAIKQEPRLVLAVGALDHADELSTLRYAFANRAAAALADYASKVGSHIGNLDQFFQGHQLSLALNGETKVSYELLLPGGKTKKYSTEQHLTKGNYTTRENAARIYFDAIENSGGLVVILYCGPHPTASFDVKVDLQQLQNPMK